MTRILLITATVLFLIMATAIPCVAADGGDATSNPEVTTETPDVEGYIQVLRDRGYAEMTNVLRVVNWWLYGEYATMSQVLEVVNLWLYPREGAE